MITNEKRFTILKPPKPRNFISDLTSVLDKDTRTRKNIKKGELGK